MGSDIWNAVSSISTLIGTIVVSITVILAYFQLKEMTAARSLEALLRVFDELTNEEMSRARRYVLSHNLPPPDQVSPEIYEQMHKVWVSFDNLGIMVAKKMIPEQIALEMFHDNVIQYWQKLEPYIQYERKKRKTKYQIFFEALYHSSLEYRNKHYPEEQDI
jgi:hypothetical protein